MTDKKILIVGAGFSGSVIARMLAEDGYLVNVIDKRDHVGGNCFDYIDENGITIHKYGPHLFHTNNLKVYEWLSRFTEWVPYKHRVKAMLADGRLVTLPVNNKTREIVGEDNIISTFYRPYSKKMWGIDLYDLDPEVFDRVKIRDDDNEYYFPDDAYQFMPKNGYTKTFERILNHKNITVSLNTSYFKSLSNDYFHTFNSMSIDEYYDYQLGRLDYRSIKFHNVKLPFPKVFDVAQINFTHEGPYTRLTEWKNIPCHGDNLAVTVLTYEEPCNYLDNNDERYYPVKDVAGSNKKLYERYKSLSVNGNVTFIGRCGQYLYLDMHQAISNSMAIANEFISKNRK